MEPIDFYHRCLRQLFPDTSPRWPLIEAAYNGRAYHNIAHLREMLSHHPALQPLTAPAAAAPAELTEVPDKEALFGLAIIYHDIIYIAGRGNNEAKSADFLEQHLLDAGGTTKQANYCRRLIMATKTHQPGPTDEGEESLLIDLDLAVLARSEADYDSYAAAIRHEFRRYPGFLYRRGRRKALRHLLDQENIYKTAHFQEKWETAARANLKRELNA